MYFSVILRQHPVHVYHDKSFGFNKRLILQDEFEKYSLPSNDVEFSLSEDILLIKGNNFTLCT